MQGKTNITKGIHSLMKAEWQRSRRVTRTFTEYGFNKGKLPLDLYSSMESYHYNNKEHFAREEWESRGLHVNWYQAEVFMLGMVSVCCVLKYISFYVFQSNVGSFIYSPGD